MKEYRKGLLGIEHNPPYNTSEIDKASGKTLRTERLDKLKTFVFEEDWINVKQTMYEYAPHILRFYERDTGHQVCPVTIQLLRNSSDNMIDFQTIFSWIIGDEIRSFGSYRQSIISQIYGKCAYGDIWRKTCLYIANLVELRNKFELTHQAHNPSFSLHCCLHEGCYGQSYVEFAFNWIKERRENMWNILNEALENI